MNIQPTKHKHADLILEYARQLSTGEINAGWWKWEYSYNDKKTWSVLPEPGFVAMYEYRYAPTENNPCFKPKLKLIDMHLLPLGCQVGVSGEVNAQLMHVFASGFAGVWNAGGTTRRDSSELHIVENKEFTFYDCKTGKCPVPEGCKVQVMFRDGETITHTAKAFSWHRQIDPKTDIIAYRIVGIADGYTDNPDEAK